VTDVGALRQPAVSGAPRQFDRCPAPGERPRFAWLATIVAALLAALVVWARRVI
jgi:hypothetical protein